MQRKESVIGWWDHSKGSWSIKVWIKVWGIFWLTKISSQVDFVIWFLQHRWLTINLSFNVISWKRSNLVCVIGYKLILVIYLQNLKGKNVCKLSWRFLLSLLEVIWLSRKKSIFEEPIRIEWIENKALVWLECGVCSKSHLWRKWEVRIDCISRRFTG